MEFLAGLPLVSAGVLAFIFILIVFQEAVNGFHDTANAVATVIYSNALKAGPAVALAAFMNFLGVLMGGTAVAFGLVYLLPNEMIAGVNTMEEIALFLALIVTALGWNFGTWWIGMPNSTTHTYIGSIIGVAMAHAFVRGQPVLEQINWHQGQKILITLAVSPVVGFILGFVLLKLISLFVRDPEMYRPALHHKRHPDWDTWDQDPASTEVAGAPSPEIAAALGKLPPGSAKIERAQQPSATAGRPLDDSSRPETRPPAAIRAGLVAGSAGVAFLHGSNDGQKSIGLMMLVLFALLPLSYGLNSNRLNEADIQQAATTLEQVEPIAAQFASDPVIGKGAQRVLDETRDLLALVKTRECADPKNQQSAACAKMRVGLLDLHQTISRSHQAGRKLRQVHAAADRAVDQRAYRPGPLHPVRAFLGDFSVGPCLGTRDGLRLRKDRDDAWREDGQRPHEPRAGDGGSGERDHRHRPGEFRRDAGEYDARAVGCGAWERRGDQRREGQHAHGGQDRHDVGHDVTRDRDRLVRPVSYLLCGAGLRADTDPCEEQPGLVVPGIQRATELVGERPKP